MLYRKNPTEVIEAWPWTPDADMRGVANSVGNIAGVGGEPQPGDMIAHDPKNSSEKVLISKAEFEANWVPFDSNDPSLENKTPEQRTAEDNRAATTGQAKDATAGDLQKEKEANKPSALSSQHKPTEHSTGGTGVGGATSTSDLKKDGQR